MHQLFKSFGKEGEETYLAYLPAAHILELVAEIACLSFGSRIGYADPRTIASTGACRYYVDANGHPAINHLASLDLAPGAIQEFKPTILVGVPKIWDIMKKGIEQQLKGGSAIQRHIFEAAFAACRHGASWRSCPLLSLVFSQTIGKKVFGGKLKIGVSGGGPLSDEVQTFCRVCFGAPVVQGYALTETTCGGSMQMVSDIASGVVGPPLSSVEMQLETCAEICDRHGNPYLTSDTSHWDGSVCTGRGEVLIRGPSVSMGYYAAGDDEEEVRGLIQKTEDEFSSVAPNEDGVFHWFRTGDIGLFTEDGRLKLIDRKKNLVKLKGGEYIAIEQMEAVYSTSMYVNALAGGIMVHGDGDLDRPIALVQADISKLLPWAKANGITMALNATGSVEPAALCSNSAVVGMVLKDLNQIAHGRLASNERLQDIALIPGTGSHEFPGSETSTWTPENGFLTASNKIDRNSIKNGVRRDASTSTSFMPVLQKLRAKQGAGPL